MSVYVTMVASLSVNGPEQDVLMPSCYSANCSHLSFLIENSGPGTATVEVSQSYFGTYFDDDTASVTTVRVPPGQERQAVIDVSVRPWYRVKALSSGGASALRVAVAGSRGTISF